MSSWRHPPYPRTKQALGPSFCSMAGVMKYLVDHQCPPSPTEFMSTETLWLASEMYQFPSLVLEWEPQDRLLRGLEWLLNRKHCIVKIAEEIRYQCEEESVFYTWSSVVMVKQSLQHHMGFPGSSMVQNLPAKQKMQVWSLGQEDPLEKEMATHSSSCLGNLMDRGTWGHQESDTT